MQYKQDLSLSTDDQQQFLTILTQNITHCEANADNQTLLKINLVNKEFLKLIISEHEISEVLLIAKDLINTKIAEYGGGISACYRVKDSFFIILPTSPVLLAQFTFSLFKLLQINFINNKTTFFDFKLASINFPKFGKKIDILLTKLDSILTEQYKINSNYFIEYNDSSNNIISNSIADYKSANILKKAIFNEQIRFAFQPIVSCKSGHINHYECLLRIIDNNQLLSVGPLIPVAEKLGFISIIDELVIDMVTEELHKSHDINFAVNISNLGVANNYLIDKIKDVLANPKLAARLIIEITETAVQDDLEKTKKFVKTMRNLGCKVAIDDFGAGYTSFRQLKLLPIDMIKIDGWFIRDVVNNLDNKFFVKTLVRMAEELGAQTIAEFVENGEIAKFLLDIEVDYMQGNYFSPAIINRSWQKKDN